MGLCALGNHRIGLLSYWTLKDSKICNKCGKLVGLNHGIQNHDALSELYTLSDIRSLINSHLEVSMERYTTSIKDEHEHLSELVYKEQTAKQEAKQEAEESANRVYQAIDRFDEAYGVKTKHLKANLRDEELIVNLGLLGGKYLYPINYLESYSTYIQETEQSGSSIGRAALGGLLAGGTGAIVGALSGISKTSLVADLLIEMHFSNGDQITVGVLTKPLRANSFTYKYLEGLFTEEVQLIESIIEQFHPQTQEPQNPAVTVDTATEIRKFRSLLDDGIITPEEFEAKKAQLLK